ncbi:hypothetical protein ES695_05105 [Candidatus Atribacteria bacterium 1244-E10-H5-B2]|nr:MAG: hypothetical protein ES695_05105 [Candidatus Atribacteria bacterium 1244-E10-H5-B2]
MTENLLVLFNLLRSDGSMVINKKLAHGIGLHQAMMYSELISKYLYFSNRGELKDGYFFNTVENMERDTTLSDYQQRDAISKLISEGFILCKVQGLPPKRYFRILVNEKVFSKLSKIMLKDIGLRINTQETKELNLKKLKNPTNNTNLNNTNLVKSNSQPYFKRGEEREEDDDGLYPKYIPKKDNRTPEELKRDRLKIAELAGVALEGLRGHPNRLQVASS